MDIQTNQLTSLDSSRHQIAQMLENTKWANEFSWNQLMAASEYIDAYSAEKGTVIFNEGAIDNSMGIIVKGKIDIMKTDQRNVKTVIATLHAGGTFGEMSLIDSEPRSALAVAASDLTILMISKDKFLALAKSKPLLAFHMLMTIAKLISRRLRKTSGQLVEHLSEERVN